jgi:formiminoglutamase
MAFNIDSHFDVRDDTPRNSGTPYRQLLEEGYIDPTKFFEIAGKQIANSPAYRRYLDEKQVSIYSLDDVRKHGIASLFKEILTENIADSIFWGFDLDVVRSNDAPGVSAGYPIGLTAEEICRIAQIAGNDERTRIFEISEVNPDYDIDNQTGKLAAIMIMYFLGSVAPITTISA